MAFGQTIERLALVMAESGLRRRSGFYSGLDTGDRAFEAAQGKDQAAVCHRFDGIAASRRPASIPQG